MGMLLTGHNKIRDFHSGILTHTEGGTGTNAETTDDTDLQTPVSATERIVTTTTTYNQALKKEGYIASTDGIGNNYTELGFKTSSPEQMQSRITFTAVSHTNAEDIIIDTRWVYRDIW